MLKLPKKKQPPKPLVKWMYPTLDILAECYVKGFGEYCGEPVVFIDSLEGADVIPVEHMSYDALCYCHTALKEKDGQALEKAWHALHDGKKAKTNEVPPGADLLMGMLALYDLPDIPDLTGYTPVQWGDLWGDLNIVGLAKYKGALGFNTEGPLISEDGSIVGVHVYWSELPPTMFELAPFKSQLKENEYKYVAEYISAGLSTSYFISPGFLDTPNNIIDGSLVANSITATHGAGGTLLESTDTNEIAWALKEKYLSDLITEYKAKNKEQGVLINSMTTYIEDLHTKLGEQDKHLMDTTLKAEGLEHFVAYSLSLNEPSKHELNDWAGMTPALYPIAKSVHLLIKKYIAASHSDIKLSVDKNLMKQTYEFYVEWHPSPKAYNISLPKQAIEELSHHGPDAIGYETQKAGQAIGTAVAQQLGDIFADKIAAHVVSWNQQKKSV